MTRPKVDPDKRQRTAQACDSCKRRKQKCNGLKPCNTCTRRNLECSYTPNNPDHGPASPPKRRHIEAPPASAPPASLAEVPPLQAWDQPAPVETKDLDVKGSGPPVPSSATVVDFELPKPLASAPPREHDFDNRSRNSTPSGPDEEASVWTSPRMLQDSTGRLLYIGDSATLSYLQLIRMIVESIVGQSPFTLDPRRHRIMENTISLPPNIRPPHLLPDRQTANVLIESYFTNTNGLLEVFNRKNFMVSVDACYSDPLGVDSSFLCLLYLTLAIGLVFATPLPGTREEATVKRLRAEQFDRAELFFRSAKCLADPVSGFEDADFWSVQALLLMAVYMLAVSKRNAAYAYYGMAVRSAFALGLHREETMVIFSAEELAVRRNLWRTLFVLDRFLSASLGRPTAISEEDCSGEALKPPGRIDVNSSFASANLTPSSNSVGLDAAVRSCHVIGEILKNVYSKRKISTRVAQEIADRHKNWPSTLHPSLHWRQAMNRATDPAQGIAILHVNLMYCHSIVLLTRPFFLYLLTKVEGERASGGHPSLRISSRMEKFSEACVQASYHTIVLVQIAFESSYLPQRNPFVLYFLFAASLIVLSNEFALLYHNASYGTCINNAIAIIRYCSETDPQADRLLYILTTFRDAVASRTAAAMAAANISRGHPTVAPLGVSNTSSVSIGSGGFVPSPDFLLHRRVMPTISASPSSTFDPIASFFTSHDHSYHAHLRAPTAIPTTTHGPPSRQNSSSALSPAASLSPTGRSMQPPPPPKAQPKPDLQVGITSSTINGVSPANSAGTPMATGTPHAGDTDTLQSAEAEFDFDSLWNWPGAGGSADPLVASNRNGAGEGRNGLGGGAETTRQPAGYTAFIGHGPPGHGGPPPPAGAHGIELVGGIGLGANVPLYPTSDFG